MILPFIFECISWDDKVFDVINVRYIILIIATIEIVYFIRPWPF